jgi:Ca-activated chloride channel family protein
MLTFAYAWFALLSPLPLAAWLVLPGHSDHRAGLRVPFFDRLAGLAGAKPRGGGVIAPRGAFRLVVLTLCWLLTVTALMRPQWIEPPLHHDEPTRDMLLLVDLSGSMETKDFVDATGQTVDRLTAVREVLDDFLSRRKGDRVGIVVFGDAPFTLVPFTTDLELCRTLLRDMAVGMAGPRTAFGDAIGLGIRMFDHSTVKTKTIVALTDGNDTASKVPPAEAASVARDRGIVIHTVAVGDPTAVGEDKLDEKALQDVAKTTGGDFFRALDRAGLVRIYAQLDALETRKIDTVSFRPKRDIYWIPLVGALILSMLGQALHLLSRQLRLASAARRLPDIVPSSQGQP